MFKTCSRCGEAKSIRDFVKDKRYKDGLSNVCRACWNAYNPQLNLAEAWLIFYQRYFQGQVPICLHI